MGAAGGDLDMMDLAEWIIRDEAARILDVLALSEAEAVHGLETLAWQVHEAARELDSAQLAATNHEAAAPDEPAAPVWCHYCGATSGVVDNGLRRVGVADAHSRIEEWIAAHKQEAPAQGD